MQLTAGDLGVYVTIGQKEVLPAVIVEVQKYGAETQVLAVDAEACRQAASWKVPSPLLR
jgi:hypothetical protein